MFKELAKAIAMEVVYQRDMARERHLWLRRTSAKPFAFPTRQEYGAAWID